jgi:aspartate racemase
MKPFGLIGGTSWHSTVEYYQNINKHINRFFGNNTNPTLHIISVNQHKIHQLQSEGDWDSIADIITKHALQLQEAGVQGIALCANTPHKVLPMLPHDVKVPFLHIADAAGDYIKHHGWSKVALLGTIFTMQEDYIKGKLLQDYQIECMVPSNEDQVWMQEVIIEEMSVGVFTEETKTRYLRTIDPLLDRGSQAVVLGCTEIPLLLRGTIPSIPTIDSLSCHCNAIVNFILGDEHSQNSTDVVSFIN